VRIDRATAINSGKIHKIIRPVAAVSARQEQVRGGDSIKQVRMRFSPFTRVERRGSDPDAWQLFPLPLAAKQVFLGTIAAPQAADQNLRQVQNQ
jgi:hypothetical protein